MNDLFKNISRLIKETRSVGEILPTLLTILTGTGRYLPDTLDYNWRGNITHSLMMLYYSIFWRRGDLITGKDVIRDMGLAYYFDEELGRREVYVQNFVGVLLFIEHELIRPRVASAILKWKTRRRFSLDFLDDLFFVPQFSYALPGSGRFTDGEDIRLKHFVFAIAVDTTGSSEATSSTPTISSITHAGSDRLSTTHLNWGNSRTLTTAPTFGGSAYTQISSTVDTSDGNPYIAGHRLVAPSTSTGNLTAGLSGSSFHRFLMTSYTGVDQTTPTANETNNTGSVAPASPVDYSRTSDANGSYMWLIAKSDSGASAVAISAGGIKRVGIGSPNINCMFDSDAGVNSGNSHTMTITHAGGGQRLGVVYCMIRAVAAAGPANLKSRTGNLKANIKSMTGNTLGNMKSLTGNS